MKAGFFVALLGAVAWFGRELWPYVKAWLEDRRIQKRKEQLRAERERDSRRSISDQ